MFASNPKDRDTLGKEVWEVVKQKVEVAVNFKYLGVQISTGNRLAAREMNMRLRRAAIAATKLQKLGVELKSRVNIVVTKLHPMALFGCENSAPGSSEIAKYRSQIIKSIGGWGTQGDHDIRFQSCEYAKKDLDPQTQILMHRVRALRREAVKNPSIIDKAAAIRKKYVAWQKAMEEVAADIEGRDKPVSYTHLTLPKKRIV